MKGSVVVSLRNMNRVLEINEECAYAVVEPGVRWFDLYDAIQAGGHRLMLSIADVGWGVVGNTLDHGVTYMPYGVDMGMQCGMEVVLPNGELLRTGMGAMEGNKAWHVYKRGLGPTPDQLFMQSNFGIVTKMGVWLMPYPEVYMPLWLRLRHDDDLAPAIDTLRELMLDDTIRMVLAAERPLLASVLSERTQWWGEGDPGRRDRSDGEGARHRPLDDALRALRRRGRGRPPLRQDQGRLRADPGRRRLRRQVRIHAQLEHPVERVQGGVPTMDLNQMTAWYGGEEGGHIGFAGRALTGEGPDAIALRPAPRDDRERRPTHGRADPDQRAQLHPRDADHLRHQERGPDARRLRRGQAARARRGQARLRRYRARHLDFMDLAAEQYGFNDHAYRRFNETIKDALDPNGILAPGKSGIWPKAMREG